MNEYIYAIIAIGGAYIFGLPLLVLKSLIARWIKLS